VRIVSDTGPILSFARAGRLDILRQVFGEISIPEAVFIEIAIGGKGKPGADEVESGVWIKREAVKDRAVLNRLHRGLNLGEMEALAFAAETGAALLIDEYEGRKEAADMGIEHFGSLRVLKEAKDRGIISEIRPLLDELIASGTYISESLYEEFLRATGEPLAT
jgi:predicted nucleic acid-binding protein